MFLSHHFLHFHTLIFIFPKFLRSPFNITQHIINILSHTRQLLCNRIVPLRNETLSFLARNMHKWIIRRPPFDFVIFLNSILHFLCFLIRNRMIIESIWPFEVDISHKTLVVAEPSSTKCNLLDFIIHHHMQYTLWTCLDVIHQSKVTTQIPYFQIVCSSCK